MGLLLGGVAIGISIGGVVLFAGYPIWSALLAYSLGGISGMVILAISIDWRSDEEATSAVPESCTS